jgi:branched-chain amino acid transport system substrate-binding protein
VKVGFAGPMTGAQAHYGADFQNGITLAVEEENASKPVIGGKPVHFVLDSADDQADPRTGTTVAQKLVDDGIKGMLGHFNSGTTIPASRIYANAGIPEIAMATAPEYTQQGFKTTFRMMTSDTQQGSVAGTFAVKNLGMKKIAIVDDRTAYGQGLADQFEKAAKASGGAIVDREFTNDKAVDFKSILTKLKSVNPGSDLLRRCGFASGADGQADEAAGHQGSADGRRDGSHADVHVKLAGDAANGTVASLAGLPLGSDAWRC